MMLMVFMLSMVPLALAEEDTVKDVINGIKESIDDPEERRDKLRKARLAKDNTVKKIKHVQKNLDETRRRYHTARDKFKQAHDVFKENKGKLNDLRKRAKCATDTEECRQHKGKLKAGVKVHLMKKLDVMLSSLERLESKIENVDRLSEDEKSEALGTIAELKTDVEALKEKTEALADDTSGEDYRAAIKEIKEAWRVIKKEQKTIIAGLMNSRMDHLVAKHNEYINGMDLRIADLRDSGQDVAELERLKNKFSEHVEKLSSDHKEAQSIWKLVKSGDAEISEWRAAQKIVRQDLKESKKILREFIHTYREMRRDGTTVKQ